VYTAVEKGHLPDITAKSNVSEKRVGGERQWLGERRDFEGT